MSGESTSRERPILFSGPMVRAILGNRKTQTRRVVKLAVPSDANEVFYWSPLRELGPCPHGQPGDRLRVKEAAWMWCERRPAGKTRTGRQKWSYVPLRAAPVHYLADHPERPTIDVVSPETDNRWGWRYKAARFLPTLASRETLEVVSVRVERLQDISEEDALAEGFVRGHSTGRVALSPGGFHLGPVWPSARAAFGELWDSINGARKVAPGRAA